MNGNCHFVYGATVGAMVALNLGTLSQVLPNVTCTSETATLLVMGGILGGIFPDIDNPSSYMGQMASPVSDGIGVINEALGKKGSHHRGLLHDPVLYLAALFASYMLFTPLIGFFIGCLSHLFLDAFNPMGIPVLFKKKVSLGKFKSGSFESIIFTWVNVVLCVLIGVLCKSWV